MDTLPGSLIHGLSFVLGLICGSFTSALSYRLPRNQDFVSGRSRCPKCETSLSARDLVPVVSWLIMSGRCRHCGVPVSVRYPIIELLCGGLFLTAALIYLPQQPEIAVTLWLIIILTLALSIIDWERNTLPNGLVAAVGVLTVALLWLRSQSILEAGLMAAGVLGGGLVLRGAGQAVAAKPGMGWGDIKLAAALSLAVSLESWPVFCGTFGVFALISAVEFGWRRRRPDVPLGPALCAGALASYIQAGPY